MSDSAEFDLTGKLEETNGFLRSALEKKEATNYSTLSSSSSLPDSL